MGLSAPCPLLPLLSDNAIATLYQVDIATVTAYLDCMGRHAGVVNAYLAARKAALDWNTADE